MRQVVDRDPVGSLAGTAAQELPCPLRLGRERPFQEREGEPASFEVLLAEQAIGDEQQRGRPVAAGRLPETADDGREQRPADTVRRAQARCHELLAREVLRIGQGGEALAESVGERIGILEVVGQLDTEGLGGRLVVGDERDGAGRRGACGPRGLAHGRHGTPSTESGGSAVIPTSGRQP